MTEKEKKLPESQDYGDDGRDGDDDDGPDPGQEEKAVGQPDLGAL